MKLCWGICHRETITLILIRLFQAFIPSIQLIITKQLVDCVSYTFVHHNSFNQTFIFLGLQSLLLFVTQSIQLIERYNNSKMQYKIGYFIEEKIATKTSTIPLRYFDSGSFYDTLQRASSGQSQRIMELLNGPIQIIQNMITIITLLGVLLSFSYITGFIVLLLSIPPFIINNRIGSMRRNLLTVLIPISRKITYFLNLMKGRDVAKEVRVFQLQQFLLTKWKEQFNRQMELQLSFERKRNWLESFCNTSSIVVSTINLGLLVWFGSRNQFSIGDYVAISQAYMTVQGIATGVALSLSGTFENIKLLSDLFEFLNIPLEEEEIETPKLITQFPKMNIEGIKVRNLSFAYDNDNQKRLNNISFDIKPGQRVAIVGDNGAGKSTLIKCLIGLYRNYEGDIFYENVNLKLMSPKLVFKHVGAVFQDYSRYEFTIKENIGVGNIDDISNEQAIIHAAKKSGANDFIEKLGKKYDTEVGSSFAGGVELSGGQWQKIAISRSFFSNADILIFDEPAASLDPFAEMALYQSIAKLATGKITIMISHRLNSCIEADLILVMKNGELVEHGTHDELMSTGGYYSKMFLSQISGYQKKIVVTK